MWERRVEWKEDRAVQLDAICTSSSGLTIKRVSLCSSAIAPVKRKGLPNKKSRKLASKPHCYLASSTILLVLSFFFAPTASLPHVDILNVIPPKKKERRSSEAPSASRRALTGAARRRRRREIRSVRPRRVRPPAQRNSFCPKQVWGVRSLLRPFGAITFDDDRDGPTTIGFSGKAAAP